MAERQRYRMIFGGGLDRAAGTMAVRPGSMRDLRDVVLGQGKVRVRDGMVATAELIDETGTPLTHGCGIFAFRSEGVAIAVGYSEPDRRVHVNRLQPDGTSPEWVGHWFTMIAGAGPPRVQAAELNGKLFLAHDEQRLARRAATYIYDPLTTPQLTELAADLDGGGEAPVRFRGVCQYLQYVFGSGHDRAEVARHCLPGQPLEFARNDYAPFGATGDPILAAVPAAGGLLFFKQTEVHGLVGYSVRTFQKVLVDPLNGLAGSALVVNVGGRVFYWSLARGPRVISGMGASEDLALPLDLGAPLPADLAAMGVVEDGYAEYDPERVSVLFTFGELQYALALDSDPWRWHFNELGRATRAGGRIYSRPVEPVPSGHPEAAATTDITATSAKANWTNHDNDGDETVEVWAKPADGSWSLRGSAAGTPAPSQSLTLAGLTPATEHALAYRYRRGGGYTAGYEGGDPDAWPATARTTFDTSAPSAPVVSSATWERTSGAAEKIVLTLLLADPALETKVFRSDTGDFEDAVLLTTLAAAEAAFDDGTIAGEQAYTYWIRHYDAGTESDGDLSAPMTAFSGPATPVIVDRWSTTSTAYHVNFSTPAGSTEHYDDESGVMAFVQELPPGETTLGRAIEPGAPAPTFRLRARLVTFGVTDFSAYAEAVARICPTCPPYET